MADEKKSKPQVDVNVTMSASSPSRARPVEADTPFCIAILGDFTGRENRGLNEAATVERRRLIHVDRDNFDEVLANSGASLNLPLGESGGEAVELHFRDLDHFEPDHLFQHVELFKQLRELRKRLLDNKTFEAAARQIQGWLTPTAEPSAAPEQDTPPPAPVPAEGLLDAILSGDTAQTGAEAAGSGTSLADQLIREALAAHVVPAPDPRQGELVAAVDEAITDKMRELLHHPRLQALESAWRGVQFLTRRLETGSQLKIYLINVSREELEADLAVEDVRRSGLYKLLCDPLSGKIPWSVILGNYSLGARVEDALFLAQLGGIAQQAGAALLCGAELALVQCASFAETPDADDWQLPLNEGVETAWDIVRRAPLSAHVGLVLPRFLMRLPYGAQTRAVEAFDFEELPDTHYHEAYLWGNGAFAVTGMLAEAYTRSAWRMRPGEINQIDGLPLHFHKVDGETRAQPCAELVLTDRAREKIAARGLMALTSIAGSDALLCHPLSSLAASGEPLAGPWSRVRN